jgi:hypothetical protein
MTDPTWEDQWERVKAKVPAPLCTSSDAPALVCSECSTALVLQAHLLEEKMELGEGKGWAYGLDLFEQEYTCYQVLLDGPTPGESKRYDLVLAAQEHSKLPSKSGWIDNPKALGQGLQLSEARVSSGRDSDVNLDHEWFRGYTKRPAHCPTCMAEVAWLFEPDALYFLTSVATDLSGKGNGDAFGMVPFWGLRVTETRPRIAAIAAPPRHPDVGIVAGSAGGHPTYCDLVTDGNCAAEGGWQQAPASRGMDTLEPTSGAEPSPSTASFSTDGARPAAAPDASGLNSIANEFRRQLVADGLLPNFNVA